MFGLEAEAELNLVASDKVGRRTRVHFLGQVCVQLGNFNYLFAMDCCSFYQLFWSERQIMIEAEY